MYELENRKILIIGASSGIGAKTAEVLADAGASVILVARREEALQEVCSYIRGNTKYYVADISEIDRIAPLFDKIVAENGKLDGMVYAAGISDDVPLKFMTYERVLKTFNINYFAFVECVRQISKKKNYNRGLRIVAISSIASIRGEKAHMAYSATKAAIDSTVRCLAKELYNKEIVLNTVQPGMIATKMYYDFISYSGGEEGNANKSLLEKQYAGIGKAEDVAYAIAFLLSPKARFITGISLPVDGGYSSV